MSKQAQRMEVDSIETSGNFQEKSSDCRDELEELYEEREALEKREHSSVAKDDLAYDIKVRENRNTIENLEFAYIDLVCNASEMDYQDWLDETQEEILDEAIKMKEDIIEKEKARKESLKSREEEENRKFGAKKKKRLTKEDIITEDAYNKTKLLNKLNLYKRAKQAREGE